MQKSVQRLWQSCGPKMARSGLSRLLQPGGWKEMRYVVKRLQATFPELPLVLARWGLQNEKKERELARTAEVSAISPTLKSARNFIVQFLQLAPEPVTLEFPRARGGAHESGAN